LTRDGWYSLALAIAVSGCEVCGVDFIFVGPEFSHRDVFDGVVETEMIIGERLAVALDAVSGTVYLPHKRELRGCFPMPLLPRLATKGNRLDQ
jgi:hypothetical protein